MTAEKTLKSMRTDSTVLIYSREGAIFVNDVAHYEPERGKFMMANKSYCTICNMHDSRSRPHNVCVCIVYMWH